MTSLYSFGRTLPVIRSAKYTSPPYHVGSTIENVLGLQVFRVLGKAVHRRFRRSFVTEEVRNCVQMLEHYGVVTIKNFLPPDEFTNVVNEFELAGQNVPLTPYKGVANAKLYRRQIPVSQLQDTVPTIVRNFQENAFLRQIVSALIRRPIRTRPDVLLDTYQLDQETGIDNDIENILHSDLHVPTIKMFFYIEKADQSNGAFIYAKRSHRLTFARLIHEYEMSIREARFKNGARISENLVARRALQARNIVHPRLQRLMKVRESQICVEPNTLVIADNMGFHRRGEFTCSRPRKALLINFRNAEPTFW